MDGGAVIGQTWTGTCGASIAWIPQGAIDPRGHGSYESSVEIRPVEGPSVSFGDIARRPRFPPWRCTDCKHVEFSYDERTVPR